MPPVFIGSASQQASSACFDSYAVAALRNCFVDSFRCGHAGLIFVARESSLPVLVLPQWSTVPHIASPTELCWRNGKRHATRSTNLMDMGAIGACALKLAW
jgi:hypothetical protein